MKTAILSKQSFIGAAFGTLIEYYDFVLFIIFLPIIAPLFFPADTPYHSLTKGYFILFISAIARPLGGAFFGYFGDTLGRRTALLYSMYGIAIATLMIGLTPSYAVIGDWAIAIILFAKAIQAFCFGGEFSGAGLYVVEHALPKKEGFISSLLATTTLFGSLLASLVGVLLTANFMPPWSWRLAFISGGFIGLFAIFYRKKMLEVPQFKSAEPHHNLTNLIKRYPRELCAGLFVGGLVTVPYMTVLGFVSSILVAKGHLSHHGFMLLQTLLNCVAVLVLLGVSLIADSKTPRNILRLASWSLALLAWPLFYLMDHGSLIWVIFSLVVLIILNEIFLGPANAYLKNLFSHQYRYRGIALSFCTGMSLFGSLTPLVESYLYELTGHMSSAALWLILISIGTVYSMWAVTKNQVVAYPLGTGLQSN